MAEKLEPGWYWVKQRELMNWRIAKLTDMGWWHVNFLGTHEAPAIIGPRIEPPVDSGEG